jgi:hypothetical protein
MTSISDSSNIGGRHKYTIACYDDTSGILNGPYFKVTRVANNIAEAASLNTYELDIGFPDADAVVNFTINTDEGYAILYNYNEKQY